LIADTKWKAKSRPFNPDELDPLIKPIVMLLRDNGIKTYTSCQGGKGHCFPLPHIAFNVSQDYNQAWRKVLKAKTILATNHYYNLHCSLSIDAHQIETNLIGEIDWLRMECRDSRWNLPTGSIPSLHFELVRNRIFTAEQIRGLDKPPTKPWNNHWG
jgi:hypothetical protein